MCGNRLWLPADEIAYLGAVAKRNASFWWLQIPGWLLLIYLVIAQAIPAFDYEIGVRMGTQEPASRITEVGVAFFYGFAVGDLLFYIPIFALGLVGQLLDKSWWRITMAAALGITVYWPIVCLVTVVDARDAVGWDIDDTAYFVVLPAIALWGLWGFLHLARQE